VKVAERHRKTRKSRSSELAEDYVEVIADLQQEFGEARLVEVADRLGVTHVTATRALTRLERLGLVHRQRYRAIFLTTEGRNLAQLARYRHTIVLDFLRALGVEESVAQNDAEGIEHHVSSETLKAFAAFVKRGPKRRARGVSS
jgi:DtxR family manganese transport transcriptional regulator